MNNIKFLMLCLLIPLFGWVAITALFDILQLIFNPAPNVDIGPMINLYMGFKIAAEVIGAVFLATIVVLLVKEEV